MEARQILGAEHFGIECLGILGGKCLVGEVNQDHQTTEVIEVKVRQVNIALNAAHVSHFHFLLVNKALGRVGKQCKLNNRALVGVMGKNRGFHKLAVLVELGVNIGSSMIELNGIAIGRSVKTIELVTIELNGHQCSIGLRHLYQTTVGRAGITTCPD